VGLVGEGEGNKGRGGRRRRRRKRRKQITQPALFVGKKKSKSKKIIGIMIRKINNPQPYDATKHSNLAGLNLA